MESVERASERHLSAENRGCCSSSNTAAMPGHPAREQLHLASKQPGIGQIRNNRTITATWVTSPYRTNSPFPFPPPPPTPLSASLLMSPLTSILRRMLQVTGRRYSETPLKSGDAARESSHMLQTEGILYSGCAVIFVLSRETKQSLSTAPVMPLVMGVMTLWMVVMVLSAHTSSMIDPHR